MGSILETIETVAVAALESVASIASVRALNLDDIPIKMDEEGRVSLIGMEPPANYPSADIAIDESSITYQRASAGGNRSHFRVPVMVLLRVATDGQTIEGARRKAWEEGEAVTRKMMATVPDLSVNNATTLAPFEPGPQVQLPIDANSHGLFMEFVARYSLTATI